MVMADVVTYMPTGGSMAQVRWLSPKADTRPALFCIQRVNSRNDSESWCQHHKHCPGIIIIIRAFTVFCMAL